ncbi:transposase [Candidatus Bathyarchaeota archaeon]|nr:transposase [Candidatus Bathyarchaeota archaeon]
MQYNPEWDLRALMLRQLEQIPYIKDHVKRLRRDPSLRQVCGYGKRAPCEAHFTQMKKRIGAEGFRIIESWLRKEAMKHRRSQPISAAGLIHARALE